MKNSNHEEADTRVVVHSACTGADVVSLGARTS